MPLDISDTIVAKSDQLNADDLIAGPVVVRIERAARNTADQPVKLDISGGHKPWLPCKTMRRVLSFAWGTDAEAWVGRWVELYRDPTVKWAGDAVGGIRISSMSHIERSMTIRLAETKGGKKLEHKIGVLTPPSSRTSETAQDTRSPLRILQEELADIAPADVVTAWVDSLDADKRPTDQGKARGLVKAVRNNPAARASLDAFLSPSEPAAEQEQS